MSDTIRVPATVCLRCGHHLDAIGGITGERGPQPGDPIACIRCGGVMTVDAENKLCGFTDEQMDELTADAEAMAELARMVKGIHFVNASQN